MKVISEISLRDFKFWSGGEDRAKNCTDEQLDKIESIMESDAPESGWTDDENKDFIMENFSDEYLEDYSNVMAWQFNSDMKKYLHNPDHRICGNFNNINYDYPYHIYGEVTYDTPLVNAMIARLDAGEDSEQANEDRDFLVDWFFETFGTWGISYNFQSNISEFLYMEFKNQQS